MAKKIIIASGKGGVGKSSLAVGLSFALRDMGKRVLAMDCDVGLRSLDLLYGVAQKVVYDWGDAVRGACTAQQALLDVQGVSLLASPLSQDDAYTHAHMQALAAELDDEYDFILIDAPAGVGGEFLSAACMADCGVVVATADEVCLRSAARAADVLRQNGVEDLRLVLNRFHRPAAENSFLCSIDDSIDRAGVRLLGVVPEDPNVSFRLPRGEALPKKSAARAAWKRIARRLNGENIPLRIQ